jgi:DNA-binding response OmpR family regulator
MKKILIVEDEPDMCFLLDVFLSGKGVQMDHVNSLRLAREYFSTEIPDVLILDNQLTDGYGVDLVPHIKKAYPSMKVIMISGTDGAVKEFAMENGIDIFLEKPFSKSEIMSAIKHLTSVGPFDDQTN